MTQLAYFSCKVLSNPWSLFTFHFFKNFHIYFIYSSVSLISFVNIYQLIKSKHNSHVIDKYHNYFDNLVYMSSFIPKNARKIIANSKLSREYFLKPYGLDVFLPSLSFLKIKISPKVIPNTNFSNINFCSKDPERILMITSCSSKSTKIYQNPNSNSTSKNSTTLISRRSAPPATWEE